MPPDPPAVETAEQACAEIRGSLSALAKSERAEAFALDLNSAPGSETAMIETRLAAVLDRTSHLRQVLRRVRHNAAPHDARVEQCTKMGFHALVEAEHLTTNVEEILASREARRQLPALGVVRSDAASPGSAAVPP